MLKYVAGFVVAAYLSGAALSAHADKLDDIIDSWRVALRHHARLPTNGIARCQK